MPDSAFALNIYQPMVFVGLGGTGCAIGTELERRLRQALCGADGAAFAERMGANAASVYLPYQLPGCVQFVYADLNEAELDRIHGASVPGPDHLLAAARNAHLVRGLVPRYRTYPEVAGHLRLAASEYVSSWLPPMLDEPRVSPITRGAGQLPTVGRAALFETLREDVSIAQHQIIAAIDKVSEAGAELAALGGRSNHTCDVFVAFSVAGGTGTGIFYDYLHLIGDAFDRAGIGVQIYPLILMPSAFEEGQGGGRPARLNAGRALLDLFRLVDDQNARKGVNELSQSYVHRSTDVAYPSRKIQIKPGIVQTAFLFSRTPGMNRDDIHRSIASLVLSLISAEQPDETQAVVGESFQSFADSFINAAAERNSPADSGIGYRSVSTSLVASLTVPGDELAELVSSRLLSRAAAQLDRPPAGGTEQNVPMVTRLARAANLGEIVDRPGLPIGAPRPVNGAGEILRSLKDHSDSMGATLRALGHQLEQQVPDIAQQRFQPRAAAALLLDEVDVFRLQRVLKGHPELLHPADQTGLRGLMEARRGMPPQPAGRPAVTVNAPHLPDIRNRTIGPKAKWGDPQVQAAMIGLTDWYKWNTERQWNEAWARQSRVWQPKLDSAIAFVDDFAEALRVFARAEPDDFDKRVVALTRDRTGIRQLLPAQGRLDVFYREVLRRFLQRDDHPEGAAEAAVVSRLLTGRDWQRAFAEVTDNRSPQRAVASLRERLKQEVKTLFEQADGSEVPLLPSMSRLLARAASQAAADVEPGDLRQFEDQVRALLPGGFTPQGSGKLKILIAHPRTTATDADIRRYLGRGLSLPPDADKQVEFRPGQSDSIVVVLFRTSMAINEVREVRELLKYWSDALRGEQPGDFLRWRQRLGYDYGWLATAEEHRVLILHRLLCAMWNGLVDVCDGLDESPREIRVRTQAVGDAAQMTLRLRRLGQTSSWGSLLRSYEEWTLADDDPIRRRFALSLSTIRPDGLTDELVTPSPLFATFMEVAEEEAARVEKARTAMPANSKAWADQLVEFWKKTVPAAMDRPFPPDIIPVRGTLRELFAYVTSGD